MREVKAYVTEDGTVFTDELRALQHESTTTLTTNLREWLLAYGPEAITSSEARMTEVVAMFVQHRYHLAELLREPTKVEDVDAGGA